MQKVTVVYFNFCCPVWETYHALCRATGRHFVTGTHGRHTQPQEPSVNASNHHYQLWPTLHHKNLLIIIISCERHFTTKSSLSVVSVNRMFLPPCLPEAKIDIISASQTGYKFASLNPLLHEFFFSSVFEI